MMMQMECMLIHLDLTQGLWLMRVLFTRLALSPVMVSISSMSVLIQVMIKKLLYDAFQ